MLVKMGKRGTLVIPAEVRRRHHLQEDSLVEVESTDQGLLLRPVAAIAIEVYTPERKAEFLMGNAVDEVDLAWAEAEVRKLGLDPANFETPVEPKRRRK